MAHAVRNLAFGPFRFACRVFHTRKVEPTRIIPVTKSRRTFLSHSSIHLVPAIVALYLIIINLSGRYIGRHLVGDGNSDGIVLALIQVAAKIQIWQRFATQVWLNGTNDDFWPGRLTERHLAPMRPCVTGSAAGKPGGVCVSTGLPMLATYLAYSKNDDGGFAIYTPEQNYPRRIEGAPRVANVNAEAWSFAPHAPTSLVLTNLWADPHWYPVEGSAGKLSGSLEAEAAAVRTVCDSRIRKLSNDTESISFPNLREYDVWPRDSPNPEDYAVVKLSKPLWGHRSNDSLTNHGNLTTIFIPPSPDMASVTTGLVILGPTNGTSGRFAMVCSIDARWNKALLRMSKSGDYGIGNPGNSITASLRGRREKPDISKATLPAQRGYWRHISAEAAWLEAALGYTTSFNFGYPPYPVEDDGPAYRTTALGSLIMARLTHLPQRKTLMTYWTNNTAAVESVVATAAADAVSRTGIQRQQVFGGYTPTESVRICHQISNRYTWCPSPPAADLGRWTRLTFTGFTTGNIPLTDEEHC
ncbi:MAG: hypothetical protein Q9170_003154 [Blastenia crenularia]